MRLLPHPSIAAALLTFGPLAAAQVGPHDYIAYWDLDEGSGAVCTDVSPSGLTGTVSGAQWIPGISGTALDFDGVDDFVQLSDGTGYPDVIGNLAQGTVSLWFRFDNVPGINLVHPLFYVGDGVGGSGHSGIIIEVGHFTFDTRLYVTVHIDNAFIPLCFDTGFNLTVGQWYHFAAVVGPGFNTGYLDGEELVDRHYNFGGPTSDQFFEDCLDKKVAALGRGFFYGVPLNQVLNGAIDEVRVYDRPLGSAEILQYYQGTLCSAESAELVRLGTPPNPAAFLPGLSGGPSVGSTWDPVIDHTTFVPGATLDVALISFAATNTALPGAGVLLCDLFAGATGITTSPGTPFAIPIPSDCTLTGLSLCTQGVSLHPFGYQFANALDVTLGGA